MKASGRTLQQSAKALRLLKAWMLRRIPFDHCQHRDVDVATNVHIFIKDGHLATPHDDDVTLLADKVVFCANPTCEHVFEVQWHGFKLRTQGEPRPKVA